MRLHGIRPELVVAILVAHEVYRSHGYVLTITSCVDGKHKRASKHYTGCGLDLRTRHMAPADKPKVSESIDDSLGDDFDVVLEKDHIHIEWDPKEALA